MPIATTCPNCKALFRLPEEMAGRTVKCQKCASQFVVPKAEADTTVPGVPVAVEEEVIVAEKVQPRGPLSSMPLPPMPMDPPISTPVPKQESNEEDRYSDGKGKPPPLRKRRDDDEDDRPTRSRREEKPKAKSAATGILLGILGFCALALLTCAGGTGVWFVLKNDEPKRVRPPIAKDGFQKDFMPKDLFKDIAKKDGFVPPPPPPPFVAPPVNPGVPTKVALDKAGFYRNDNQLTFQDPLNQQNKQYKPYTVVLEKNKTYRIDMTSVRFDAYLYVVDDANFVVAQDDDSGGGLNAQIFFVPQKTATYHIEATSFGGGQTGEFTLTIQRINN